MKVTTLYYDEATCISRWLMIWPIKLIKAFRACEISPQILPPLPKSTNFDAQLDQMKAYWAAECKRAKPSYLWALLKTMKGEYSVACCYFTVGQVCSLLRIVAMGWLISWINDEEASVWTGVLYLGLFGLLGFVSFVAICRTMMILIFIVGKAKTLTHFLVAEKLFQVAYDALATGNTSSMITNIVGTDVELFEFISITYVFSSAPVVLVLSAVILWFYVGFAGLVNIGLVLLHVIILMSLGKFNVKIRLVISAITDLRIRLITSLLENVKTVKFYTWENSLLSLIFKVRNREIREFLKFNMLMALLTALYFGLTGSVVFATLWTQIELAGSITVEDAFVVVSVVCLCVFLVVGAGIPAIRCLAIILSVCQRITDALMLTEHNPDNGRTEIDPGVNRADKIGLKLAGASFSWMSPASKSDKVPEEEVTLLEDKGLPSLRNVSFSSKPGELVVILGSVGSGKTTLLVGILGEIHRVSGSCEAPSSVAYVPGEAWVMPGTLQENIVLSRPFDSELYTLAIKLSELTADIRLMNQGDSTVVSDSSLSGGQKARLSLARAIYANADLYLLDDPLSAVDPEVSVRIAKHLKSFAERGKCILLATHQTQSLRFADSVVVLNEGTQVYFGDALSIPDTVIELIGLSEQQEGENLDRSLSSTRIAVQEVENAKLEENIEDQDTNHSIYWTYFSYAYKSSVVYLPLLLLLIISQLPVLAVYYWVSVWSSADDQQDSFYVSVFGIIIGAMYVLGIFRFFSVYLSLIRSSKNMHNACLSSLVHTDAHFFDVNPIGALLNRFTKDTSIMDEYLVNMIGEGINLIFIAISYMTLIAVFAPGSLIGVAVYFGLLIAVMKIVLPLSRRLRIVELTSKTPLLSAIHSSLSGVLTIRCLGAQQKFVEAIKNAATTNFKSMVSYLTLVRFAQFVMEFGGFLIGLLTAASVVAMKGIISPELSAVSLSLTVGLNGLSIFLVRYFAEIENSMASPQRIYDYCNLTPEPTSRNPFTIAQGSIRFHKVSATYAPDLPLVLKDISFDIPAQAKVGIIGRTGAGKSSIMYVLFRMIHVTSGTVFIDGQDCSRAGLHELRKSLAVIPQFPLIFQGTVIENIDPAGEYTESQVTEALKNVQLLDIINDQPRKLETMLESDELTLSAGQKQLICLARAMVKQSKIVMMDEATANVDNQTDQFIQEVLRRCFAESTMLVIAHRLRTVIDSDSIIVMEDGMCVESGSPAELYANPTSILRQYIEHTGPKEAELLLRKLTRN